MGDQPKTRTYTDATGVQHVQRIGPAHVVEGSETVIDVPDGVTVTRRRLEWEERS